MAAADVKFECEQQPSIGECVKEPEAEAMVTSEDVKLKCKEQPSDTECVEEPEEEAMVTAETTGNVFNAPSDPFAYVNKFHTNELHKLHVTSIPRFIGYQAFKKKLNKLSLNPSKIKLLAGFGKGKKVDAHAFVVFRSKDEMEAGFKVLNGLKWKSTTLECTYAKPAADPFVKLHQAPPSAPYTKGTEAPNAVAQRMIAARNMEPEERSKELGKLLCETTEPWCEVDYSEQVQRKMTKMKDLIQPICTSETKICEIRQSPQIDYYRNKVEFTIGYGIDDQQTVGFRLGSYRFGSCWVVRPEAGVCKILPPVLCKLALEFETFLRSSADHLRPFNQVTHEGNYRFLTARINSAGQVLAILGVFSGNLHSATETVQKERDALCNYFDEDKRKELGLCGLLWNNLNSGSSDDDFSGESGVASLPEVVFGEASIIETICDLKFKISPQSFFQINTPCTEVLYSLIREFAFEQSKDPELILDLCCGTGTIGMVLLGMNLKEAESKTKVVGIELCQAAINDAKENVALNKLPSSRISFVCSKVEQALYNVLASDEASKSKDASIVAVLDPPRAGIHTSVISTIRRTTAIKRLIYVSCNPTAAFGNFEDLTKLPSRRLVGDPFVLKQVVPVDLFPHTPHCELVLLFER